MFARGAIRNREYANQVKDYSGLLYGKITPTDIDGLIDFGDHAFVIIETKHINSELPRGQRLAIQRLVDIIAETGRASIALVVDHDTPDDIQVADLLVREYRHKGKWRFPKEAITCREAIDRFLALNKIRR